EDFKAAPLAGHTVALERSVVAANDSDCSRQTQSPPHKFCGKEGLKNPADRCLVHAAACIGHLEHDVSARRYLIRSERLLNIGLVNPLQKSCHRYQAWRAFANGFSAFDDEIHDYLLKLRDVAIDSGKFLRQLQA